MKLIQFTDFHLRLSPPPQSQFHMQPFWPGSPAALFARLAKAFQGTDAVLFTGDAAHGGGEQETAVFFDLLAEASRGKPVFVVAGNHDVTNPLWTDWFQKACDRHPNIRFADGLYPLGDIDLILVNNYYLHRNGTAGNTWEDGFFPVPVLDPAGADQLDSRLSQSASRPAIVLVHCPTHALPATLAQYAAGVVPGMDLYRQTFHAVLDKHPRAALVLSGHVHFNTTKRNNTHRIHQSLASITEYPYHIRQLEFTGNKLLTRLLALTDPSDEEERTPA